MAASLVPLLLVCLFSVALASPTSFREAFPHGDLQRLRNLPVESLKDNVTFVIPPRVEFACPTIPTPAPITSINELKPGHVKVVMAMGDSITAAMSAKDTSIINLKEYRGISFSIGGDPDVTTMPNLLSAFTEPGYPIGVSTGIGKRDSAGTGLNAAESGDINADMLSQAQWLVAELKNNDKIDFNEDWKVLTIWIGSNNLCDVCDDYDNNNADNFQSNLQSALDYLQKTVPRLFVNLVANLDITQIYNIQDGLCGVLHPVECACAADSDESVREFTRKINLEYQDRAYVVAQHYAGDQDFAVVVQPFLLNTIIDDRSYLSAADCFHPSAIAHSYASISLWNNMITPSYNKTHAWSPSEVPLCAHEDTLLYIY